MTLSDPNLLRSPHFKIKSSEVKFIEQQKTQRPLTCCILDQIVKYMQNILAFKSTNDITNSLNNMTRSIIIM